MKKIAFLTVLLVLTVALFSACSPAIFTSPASGQVTGPYTINAAGTGKVYVTPDVAFVNLGVHTEAATVSEALRQNNAQAQAVAKALSDGGVAAEDVQTSAFNISPQQQFDQMGNPTSTTYVADNVVYVTVRDMGKLGQLLDAAVNAGANTVNSVSFDLQDKTKAYSEARRMAVEDARAQAQELADAAGVKLGKLTSLNAYANQGATPMYDVKVRAGVGGSSVPVAAGQLVIQMDASLSYEIEQ